MNENKGSLVILSIFVVFSLFMTMYFLYQPSKTEIVYVQAQNMLDSSSEVSSKIPSSKATSSKVSSSKANTSSKAESSKQSSSKLNSSKDSGFSTETSLESNVEYSTIYDDYSDSISDPAETSQADMLSSEESIFESEDSSKDTSSAISDDSTSINRDFTLPLQTMTDMSAFYGISIYANLEEDADEQYGAFYDSEELAKLLVELDEVLNQLDFSYIQAVSEYGFDVEIYLVDTNSANFGGIEVNYFDNRTVQLVIDEVSGKSLYQFYYALCEMCDHVITQIGDIDSIYREFSALNPTDFAYGMYNHYYLNTAAENTYFLTIAAQASIQADRATVFAMEHSGVLDEQYSVASCPIYSKVIAIEQSYLETLFTPPNS